MVTNNTDPSSSLQDKLKTIIDGAHQAASERGRNDGYTVMLIEQAFQEAGWATPETTVQYIKAAAVLPKGLMTGQEFYERFKVLIKDHGFYENVTRDFVLDAARRAAGVSDE